MDTKLAVKIVIVLAVSLLLWIPLVMISSLVGERQALRDGVLRDMAQEAVDRQEVVGPVIIVPYKRRFVDVVTQEKDGRSSTTRRERIVEGNLAFLPDNLTVSGEILPEERHRGIYKTIVYDAKLAVAGRFSVPADFGITEGLADYQFGAAALLFGVSDPRGIGAGMTLDWQGAPIEFAPGAAAPGFAGGVTAPLAALGQKGGNFDFGFHADLKGLAQIDFVPTGKDSLVSLASTWPNPSFYGRYLPQAEISDNGFTARWHTSFLSTNARQAFERCLAGPNCADFTRIAHGVALYQPVDIYQQLERTSKYGFLFSGLTFIAFFFFEVLRRLDIHPVQYGLVGIALAMFYLLLISLSERIGFALAYAVASGACVALIGFYVCHVLRSLARGLSFAAMLSGLYGTLYVLVRAQDNALLMGSVALFALLAAVMIGTRKVNWYAIAATGVRQAP
jgi:inner membrane protein